MEGISSSILETAIFARWRSKKETPFFAVEVIQMMFPVNWEVFKSDLSEELYRLLEHGQINICNSGDFDLFKDLEQIKIKVIGKP
jgi:hypothetical protein